MPSRYDDWKLATPAYDEIDEYDPDYDEPENEREYDSDDLFWDRVDEEYDRYKEGF